MKRTLRFICVFLSVLMCLTVYAPAAFAVTEGGISLSASTVKRGEYFNVYITIPAQTENAQSLTLRADFDPLAFEVTEWSARLGISSDLQMSKYDNTDGYFIISAANSAEEIDLSAGLAFTAKLRVKTDAAVGRYVMMLTRYSVNRYDTETGENVTVWVPDSIYSYITVEESASNDTLYPIKSGGLSISSYALHRGESFDVFITVPAMRNAESASLLVEYEPAAFDVTMWQPDISAARPYTGSGYFSVAADNSDSAIKLINGLTLKATMRVRDNAPTGSYYIKLSKGSFTFYDAADRKTVELWSPQNTLINVSVYEALPAVTTTTFYPAAPVIIPETTNPPAPYDRGEEAVPDTGDETEALVPPEDDTGSADEDEEIVDIDGFEFEDIDDPDDHDYNYGEDDESYYAPDISEDEYEVVSFDTDITLDCSKLTGLTSANVTISTKSSFFDGETVVVMSKTDYAASCANEALRRLGLTGRTYYPFDISVYNVEERRFLSSLPEGGYIEFIVPLPKDMTGSPENIEVFHIAEGLPSVIDRVIETEDGETRIRFSADTFSPYMFVDMTKRTAAVTGNSSGQIQNGGDVRLDDDRSAADPNNGVLNPGTGVAAAIVLPAALTGCVLLARKTVRRRKRAKQTVDDIEEE